MATTPQNGSLVRRMAARESPCELAMTSDERAQLIEDIKRSSRIRNAIVERRRGTENLTSPPRGQSLMIWMPAFVDTAAVLGRRS
jgi:hypothetical protein